MKQKVILAVALPLLLLTGCERSSPSVSPPDRLTPAKIRFIKGCDFIARSKSDTMNDAEIALGIKQAGCLDVTADEWAQYEEWRKDGGSLDRPARLVPVDP